MKILIAEKPSVARDIAAIVGANNRREGYLEGNGYAVTWAFGHLVGLAMPQDYGITGFQAENLPILPTEFKLLPRQVKDGKEYKPDAGALKQLKVIRELFNKSDLIINCCDAGREGEAIFRYIYNYLECSKPFDRLWISSLTDQAIRGGLENLRSGKEYDNLYYSADARAKADWTIGVNASRALSVSAGYGVWSLGRVQTPTLASRTIDEGSMDEKGGMNFSEYVAILSGNTELLEKARLEKKIASLESEWQAFMRGKSSSRYKLEDIMSSVEKNNGFINRISKDIEAFNSRIQYQPDGVTRLNPVQLDGLQGCNPKEVGLKLNEIADNARTHGAHEKIGTLYGFDLMVKSETTVKDGFDLIQNRFFVKGEGDILYNYNHGTIGTSTTF